MPYWVKARFHVEAGRRSTFTHQLIIKNDKNGFQNPSNPLLPFLDLCWLNRHITRMLPVHRHFGRCFPNGVALFPLLLLVTVWSSVIVEAYGPVGHCIIAILGYSWSSKYTKSILDIFFPSINSLCSAANWPDTIKGRDIYRDTAPEHYMSDWESEMKRPYSFYGRSTCLDIPLNKHSCPNSRCILLAMYKYSGFLYSEFRNIQQSTKARVFSVQIKEQHSNIEFSTELQESLMFIIHLVGDAYQPLHLCGKERGGNERIVLYHGEQTNLHSIWDTNLLHKKIDKHYGGSYEDYVLDLVSKDKSLKNTYKLSELHIEKYPVLSLDWFVKWASMVMNFLIQ